MRKKRRKNEKESEKGMRKNQKNQRKMLEFSVPRRKVLLFIEVIGCHI
jgi:hypothetical protein